MTPQDESIRVAGIVRQSIVDGPGLRLVVFTQGCPHHCPGCHNPETHDVEGGSICTVSNILEALDANPLLSGVTLSGGEPFRQAAALVPLARQVRDRGKNIFCYTGYTLEGLLDLGKKEPAILELLRLIDVLIDGPFIQAEKDLTLRFRGSRNQRVLDVARSLAAGAPVEADLAP